MGNLRRAPVWTLINDVTATTILRSDIQLHGTDTDAILIEDYGYIYPNRVTAAWKCCYCPCIPKHVLMKVKPKCPCDDCNAAEVGFVIYPKWGMSNNENNFLDRVSAQKPYFYSITDYTCTGGYLDVDYIEEAIANLVWMSTSTSHYGIPLIKAWERVGYGYTSGTISLTVTSLDGSYTHTYTGATVLAVVTAIGTDASARIHVYDADVDELIIEGSEGFAFTTTVTNLTKTQDAFWIRMKAVNCYVQFVVQNYEASGSLTILNEGTKPKVSPKEVARRFPIMPLSHVGMQPTLPIKDAAYCLYYVKQTSAAYDLVGANHVDAYYDEAYFYVLESETAAWDAIFIDVFNALNDANASTISSCSCASDSYDSQGSYLQSSATIR